MRFFKEIRDWILKSANGFCVSFLNRLVKIFRIMVRQRNRRIYSGSGFFGSFVAPWSSDLGLICLEKKRKIRFRILSYLRSQSWIFLKKRILNFDWEHSFSFELGALFYISSFLEHLLVYCAELEHFFAFGKHFSTLFAIFHMLNAIFYLWNVFSKAFTMNYKSIQYVRLIFIEGVNWTYLVELMRQIL